MVIRIPSHPTSPCRLSPSPSPQAPHACAHTDLILRRCIVEFGGARKVSERLDLIARQANAREQTRACAREKEHGHFDVSC